MTCTVIGWLILSFLNWGMVCGFLRRFPKGENPNMREHVLLLTSILFSPVAFPILLLGGGWRAWSWYPETKSQRIGRLTLKKLES